MCGEMSYKISLSRLNQQQQLQISLFGKIKEKAVEFIHDKTIFLLKLINFPIKIN